MGIHTLLLNVYRRTNPYIYKKKVHCPILITMLALSKVFSNVPKRTFGSSATVAFRLTVSGSGSGNMPENVEELSNSQRSVPNMNRSRECSGQQADTAFSRNFMSDQVQQCFNLNRDSMELGTFGYDMDGNANMASVLQTNLPEPFKAQSVNQLKEGLPEGLSDVVRERGQRWTMEDRLMATM